MQWSPTCQKNLRFIGGNFQDSFINSWKLLWALPQPIQAKVKVIHALSRQSVAVPYVFTWVIWVTKPALYHVQSKCLNWYNLCYIIGPYVTWQGSPKVISADGYSNRWPKEELPPESRSSSWYFFGVQAGISRKPVFKLVLKSWQSIQSGISWE